MVQELKKALAFAVGIGQSLIMLYINIKIFFVEKVIVMEPNIYILIAEIFLTALGIYYLWKIFTINHEKIVLLKGISSDNKSSS